MSEHTPLPWKLEERMSVFAIAHDGGNDVCALHFHYEHCGFPCGAVESHDKTNDEIRANAELIVRACNSFKSMFETLEAIAEGKYTEGEEQEMARAAIATAEGRKP